jgi:hypothetical protein
MRHLSLSLISLGVVGLLAACSGNTVSRATEPVYSTRVTGNDLTAANSSATAYCRQNYNTSAELVSVAPGASGAPNTANYRCITSRANVGGGGVQNPPTTPSGGIIAPSPTPR